MNHRNIVKAHDFYITDMEIYTVLDLVKGEELLNRISDIEKYDEHIA